MRSSVEPSSKKKKLKAEKAEPEEIDDFVEDEVLLPDDDEPLLVEDDDGLFIADDDAPLLLEDDGLEEQDESPPLKKEVAWTISDPATFIQNILDELATSVGPYVPFSVPEDDPPQEEEYKWKCLQVLRVLGWNFGKLETIFDNQSEIIKSAGLLENPASLEHQDTFTCSICCDDYPFEETSALDCQHRFCNGCWQGWISDKLNSVTYEGLFDALTCQHKGCHVTILGPLVKKLCSDKDWNHYLRMLVKSFCSVNHASYSICPNCNKVAKANVESKAPSVIVSCTCDHQYCFRCLMAPHVPASCHDLELWRAKDQDDEASLNLIKATTTECPKCGLALDRTTACNHITCKCTYQFCFVCKEKWGSCSIYSCSKFKTREESEQASSKEFSKGYKTSSEWLVAHERYIAFGKKYLENKIVADKCCGDMMVRMKKKALDYRELKPGGNPQFIIEGTEILGKSHRIMQYTLVWGFTNIPALVCPQKVIFEMQFKNYERMTKDLLQSLEKPVDQLDHLLTKRQYTMLQDNLIKQIEEAEDLLSMFSEKKSGNLGSVSALSRWTCPKKECNYSNHPVEQAKACLLCKTPRPEVTMSWFPD